MDKTDTPQGKRSRFDPRIHHGVPQLLEEKGFSSEEVEALLGFDMAMFQWRRIAEKGDFKGRVLDDLDDKLDPAVMQGLLSVAQIAGGIGRARAEPPTIGLVAELMQVDPSRASRIVAALVEKGYVERQAAQDDARKSVLALTPKARDFLGAFTRAKWGIMAEIFEGWDGAEVTEFTRLFTRYVGRLSAVVSRD